jgi:FkbM family methyltransferase
MLCRPETDTHFKGCNGPFEGKNLLKAVEICTRFGTVIDGGAHIGSWSVYLSNVFENVLSFEPLKSNYDCLVENTKNLPNVQTFMAALGDEDGRMSMHPPVNPGNSGAGWLMDGDDFDVITIDSLDLEELDFLKLDIEGYEPHAIAGALKTIKRFKPIVLVEQKPITARFGVPFDVAGQALENLGYKLRAKMNNDYIYS